MISLIIYMRWFNDMFCEIMSYRFSRVCCPRTLLRTVFLFLRATVCSFWITSISKIDDRDTVIPLNSNFDMNFFQYQRLATWSDSIECKSKIEYGNTLFFAEDYWPKCHYQEKMELVQPHQIPCHLRKCQVNF